MQLLPACANGSDCRGVQQVKPAATAPPSPCQAAVETILGNGTEQVQTIYGYLNTIRGVLFRIHHTQRKLLLTWLALLLAGRAAVEHVVGYWQSAAFGSLFNDCCTMRYAYSA